MKNGGGQNARATGGPGILPETRWIHCIPPNIPRTSPEDTGIPGPVRCGGGVRALRRSREGSCPWMPPRVVRVRDAF